MREVQADVTRVFPGTWRWRTAFMLPDRYAWTIQTATEPDHYLFDGAVVRAFIGTRLVAVDSAPHAPLRGQARLEAVVGLDALELPGVRVAPLPASELPPGTRAGLVVVFADDGASYRVAFDRRDRLVWATGPASLPPLGEGAIVARFGDFRRAGGVRLPFRISYALNGEPLAEARVVAVCPNDPRLGAASFQAPELVPDCPRH